MNEKFHTIVANGEVITPFRRVEMDVEVENGLIRSVAAGIQRASTVHVIDARNCYVIPGLIDLHAHGGGGYDFMDATEEAFIGAGKAHLAQGTTTMLPTTLSSTLGSLEAVLSAFVRLEDMDHIPLFPGLHLEGPYFSQAQRGAQDKRFIKNPDPSEYAGILKRYSSRIARWSVAPELPGSFELARLLRKKGIIASIAHTDATHEQILESLEHGFSMMTHFYSGMSGLKRIDAYRVAGAIESGFLLKDLPVEIIADGSHLPPTLLQLIYQQKSLAALCIVSDALRAAGYEDGEYFLGSATEGRAVIIEDGVAKLPDRSAFAGSVTMGCGLIRVMYNHTTASLEETVRMMTVNPARLLQLSHRKGSVAPGMDADLVIMKRDFSVRYVLRNGKIVYRGPGEV